MVEASFVLRCVIHRVLHKSSFPLLSQIVGENPPAVGNWSMLKSQSNICSMIGVGGEGGQRVGSDLIWLRKGIDWRILFLRLIQPVKDRRTEIGSNKPANFSFPSPSKIDPYVTLPPSLNSPSLFHSTTLIVSISLSRKRKGEYSVMTVNPQHNIHPSIPNEDLATLLGGYGGIRGLRKGGCHLGGEKGEWRTDLD